MYAVPFTTAGDEEVEPLPMAPVQAVTRLDTLPGLIIFSVGLVPECEPLKRNCGHPAAAAIPGVATASARTIVSSTLSRDRRETGDMDPPAPRSDALAGYYFS